MKTQPCNYFSMYRPLLIFLIAIWFLQGCDLVFETTTPVTWGMVKGKVVEWDRHTCYMIDLGTVYKPEHDTVIFVVGIGPDHERRSDWVVEAQCNKKAFVRGIGEKAFPKLPDDIASRTIQLACESSAPPATLEHPLGMLNEQERTGFVYSRNFDENCAPQLVAAVTYWARKRFEESEGLTKRQ
jgi:hypothetical protein